MKETTHGLREDYLMTEDIRYEDLCPHVLGHHICTPKHSNRPKLKKQALIHYVLRGQGYFYDVNGRKTRVKAGQIFIILPGESSSYAADEENPWEYIWVNFSGKMTERLRSLGERVITMKDGSIFTDLLCQARGDTLTPDYFVSRLFLLYGELLASQNYGRRYEEEVAHYIEMYYMRELSVAELSDMVHLDRSYLTRIFTHHYQMSPKEYLSYVRMRHARELLVEGASVAAVAEAVGYRDVSVFSKAFKRKVGVSPRTYAYKNEKICL